MNNKIIILASLLLSMISTVNAEEKAYAEIGFGSLAVEDSGWRFVPKIGRLIIGTKVMDSKQCSRLICPTFCECG